MNRQSILLIVQIVISLLLVGAILLQAQGSGLGSTWGGGGESFHTRRGVEKVLFRSTIILIIVFFCVSIAAVALR
ncbi:preprotein translocase subunit SecG [Candidatus Cerribacteria bacterium 'Amazon FNV 2010 28 9']|uniref:Protein-export membrane protein SecG n=1 Tax=Candidatus Cerribacteria bacterium 'Amazon FNV 2010 28 9' TaxID=2081795 RepID=A0A317JRW6_9BACT|nr:MAG: preprotein translocase subunit SecG [Candidatus Cerribacteria bacterium 'Amazon FNV 2010 28 9']